MAKKAPANPVLADLLASVEHALAVTPSGKLKLRDDATLKTNIRRLAEKSALGTSVEQGTARWLIWEAALAMGVYPASINGLYMARGRGETPVNFTVPAMNLRALTFDCARAAFRAAERLDAGALLFEIARSEMSYTFQRPSEYVSSVLAAAIAEGYTGPVFIQGDHFQVNHKKYLANPEAEVNAVRELAVEAVAAGFYNIDVDTSTLVDISLPTIPEQQRENTRRCAELTAYIRGLEPKGITISVGGEIGEVGAKNSTEQELRAFMDGYKADLLEQPVNGKHKRNTVGMSKISIQTGTSHGGVVNPDGTMAKVQVDFDTLRRLSYVARHEYGMAGAVQHGASTLPEDAFHRFPECETAEIHLATNFMTMLFDRLPMELRAEIYDWVRANAADERKAGDTEDQFLYKSRKKAVGPFKAQMWNLPEDRRANICGAWEEQFYFLFEQLNIKGTRALVDLYTKPVLVHKTLADYGAAQKEVEDVTGLAD
ncbi:MAG: class II fructose-bisphosphate aldolase [Anaerolineales bacterium]|nr:class II fructose-bisphosphate aldolase [Anaerolineales bacterium]